MATSSVDLSHTRTVEETLAAYKVTEDEGLTPEKVLELRSIFGYNGECMWIVLCIFVCF